jgi:hypothetical protein
MFENGFTRNPLAYIVNETKNLFSSSSIDRGRSVRYGYRWFQTKTGTTLV